ncbi:vitamin D-binding protein [Vipera latastei]
MVELAKKCCAAGAAPDCYENESTAFSEKSCRPDAPFPRHPGIAGCCAEQGLSRKLCLAALKHLPKEFPTYVEPSNEEICDALKKDPHGFEESQGLPVLTQLVFHVIPLFFYFIFSGLRSRFLAEYSSDYSYAPLPILLNSTRNYLSLVRTCCASTQRTVCFLKERLQHKPIRAFTRLSNRACALYALLGKNKTKVSYLIKFTQQTPTLPFENAITLAGEASEILSKCCASLEENCIQNELKLHIAHICNTACAGNERIRTCCTSKDDVGKYLCIYSLPWAKHSEVPQSPSSIDEGVCRDGGEIDIYRNIFDVARIYTRAPEALIITLYSASQAAATDCCDLLDVKRCFTDRVKIQNLLMSGTKDQVHV